MDLETIREHCLLKPGVEETFPFDEETLVLKVAGKMFLLINIHNPESINIKCGPQKALELRAEHEEIQPGWHMNKKHWNTVSITGRLPRELILDMINNSYDLVVSGLPKKDKEFLKNAVE